MLAHLPCHAQITGNHLSFQNLSRTGTIASLNMSVLCSSDRPLIMTVTTVIINGRSEEHKTDMFNMYYVAAGFDVFSFTSFVFM